MSQAGFSANDRKIRDALDGGKWSMEEVIAIPHDQHLVVIRFGARALQVGSANFHWLHVLPGVSLSDRPLERAAAK